MKKLRKSEKWVLKCSNLCSTHTQNLYPTLSISIWLVKKKRKVVKTVRVSEKFYPVWSYSTNEKKKKNPRKDFPPETTKQGLPEQNCCCMLGGKKLCRSPSKRDWRKAVGKSQHQKDTLNGEGPLRKWLFTNSSSNNNGHTNKLHNHHKKTENPPAVDSRRHTRKTSQQRCDREEAIKKVN